MTRDQSSSWRDVPALGSPPAPLGRTAVTTASSSRRIDVDRNASRRRTSSRASDRPPGRRPVMRSRGGVVSSTRRLLSSRPSRLPRRGGHFLPRASVSHRKRASIARRSASRSRFVSSSARSTRGCGAPPVRRRSRRSRASTAPVSTTTIATSPPSIPTRRCAPTAVMCQLARPCNAVPSSARRAPDGSRMTTVADRIWVVRQVTG